MSGYRGPVVPKKDFGVRAVHGMHGGDCLLLQRNAILLTQEKEWGNALITEDDAVPRVTPEA